jgi:predicted DCC family thiol-disulfide oxidoreductase YuxK/uncharacterized membrane protein YphA (DoxX/SURF4 family)
MAAGASLDPHRFSGGAGPRLSHDRHLAVKKSLFRRLHDHWFEPAPLEDLAFARMVLVGMELLLLLVPALAHSGGGACRGCNLAYQEMIAAADPWIYHPIPALKVLLLPLGWGARPGPAFLHAVWLLAVGSGVAALIGLFTRASLLVFAATTTLLIAHAYSYGEIRHPEAALTIALWVLAVSPAGARWSVDHLRRRIRRAGVERRFEPDWRPGLSPHARWPLRAVQWVLILVYFSGAYSKLRYGGIYWFNRYTLTYDVGFDALERGVPLGVWMAQRPGVLQLMSIGAVAIELGFGAIMVWPALAWVIILSGAALHTGIYALQGSSFPQYLALYCVFIGELRTAWPMRTLAAGRLRAAMATRRWTVLYDGLCPLCIRSMAVLDVLDTRGALAYVDVGRSADGPAATAADIAAPPRRHGMHVVGQDGSGYHGYLGLRALTRALPPLWPIVPFLMLPLADRIGAAIYSRVARTRSHHAVCRAETAAAPLPRVP